MRSHSVTRARQALAIVFAAATVAGCAGGSGSPGVTPMRTATAPPGTTSTAKTANVTFTIVWPQSANASSSARNRSFVSPSTLSATIAIKDSNGSTVSGSPFLVANPNVGGGTTATAQPSTALTVVAPIGTDTFQVSTFDRNDGTGNLLSQNSVMYTIVQDVANVVPLTLNGNLGKVACQAVAPFLTPSAPQAFTMTGPAGQIAAVPEDIDGNIIIGSGTIPAVTLAAADPSKASLTSSQTTNVFNINVLAVGAAATINASGKSLSGATVTSTCTVTRALALYVTNHGINNIGNLASGAAASTSSVTIYPVTATAASTPIATIAGSNALQSGVQFDAVDNFGNLFVTNQGPVPGATFGPQAGYVAIYGPGAFGNVAPVSTIPNLNTPEGITFDKNGMLYLMTIDSILEYPASANGTNGNGATAGNTIKGAGTDLFSCYGIAVDSNLQIYNSCSNVINVFPPGATGAVKPGLIEVAGNTAMTFSSQSWLGILTDSANNVYVAAANNNLNLVDQYTPAQTTAALAVPGTATTPTPNNVAKGTGFNEPYGMAVDPNGQFYLVNFGGSSLEIFGSGTVFNSGVATTTVSGATSGLVQPYGVTVR